jgi:hypothetical protein
MPKPFCHFEKYFSKVFFARFLRKVLTKVQLKHHFLRIIADHRASDHTHLPLVIAGKSSI